MSAGLIRLRRAWDFGRHIPPGKIARRAALALRRRAQDRRGPFRPKIPLAALRDSLPRAVFPPRTYTSVWEDTEGLHISVLGRDISLGTGPINWAAPGPGPGQQLGRMTLHYMEYLEAAEDPLFCRLVSAWLDANEPVQPGAWRDAWNAYALSIRVVVWLQQMAMRRNRLAPDLLQRMAESLLRQMAYLERNLETDIGGNHLFKNIKALIWAGACFTGPAARRWESLGRALLTAQLSAQILPDGMHYERSPAYHNQVFADLLECRAAMKAPPYMLEDALFRMARICADLRHPDGDIAQFNDAGLNMAYAPDLCLAAYARQFPSAPRMDPSPHFAYRDSGYFGFRTDRLFLITDCGPLAPDDLPAHGHGDALSFELSLDGQRVVVDQGVFEYVAGSRRDRARAARSHNTPWIEGADQAEFWGAFRCGRRARVLLRGWRAGNAGVELSGCHDGYGDSSRQIITARRITAEETGLSIHDRMETDSAQPAQIGFLLHPAISPIHESASKVRLDLPDGASIALHCSTPVDVQPAVWWPDMGRELPTHRLVVRVDDARRGVEMRLQIAPRPASLPTNRPSRKAQP